jgi:hypothetical protein
MKMIRLEATNFPTSARPLGVHGGNVGFGPIASI